MDGKVVREYALQTGPEDGPKPLRLATQRERLRQIVESARDAATNLVVAMEAEVWGVGEHTASDQSAIQAVYQVMLWEARELHFLPVNVAHVKKFAGVVKKDQILLSVFKRWGREYQDHNLADAFLVGIIGHAFYCRSVLTDKEIIKPQREVLQSLEKVGGYPWEVPQAPVVKKKKGKA